MAIALDIPETIFPVPGVRLATTYCGIRKAEKEDLTLIALDAGSKVAGVYTQNVFCAAPVQLARKHEAQGGIRYLLINAGNANAGTGQRGLDDALASCEAVAEQMAGDAASVLPFSTGVIGEYLPVEKIRDSLPKLSEGLSEAHWLKASEAIMTTDTCPKIASHQLELETGETITLTGISKGAGMICPDMATMLSYIATDAAITQEALQILVQEATAVSFNSITVDGDTSTNDSCILIATGQAGNAEIDTASADYPALRAALIELFQLLAQAIVRDAEGISKFVAIEVNGGRDRAECKQLAYTIAHSPLVKTALFASDPNWGRILAAIGRAGLEDLVLEDISFSINEVQIVSQGGRDPGYTEEQGVAATAESELTLSISLGRGDTNNTLWTCDLGYEYVRINAEYRT